MIHEEFISLIESAASRLPSDWEELPTGIRSDDGFYSVIYIFPDGSDPDKCIQQVKDTFKSSGFNPYHLTKPIQRTTYGLLLILL